MAKEPLNKAKKNTSVEEPEKKHIPPINESKEKKKEGFIKQAIFSPFRWMVKKTISFTIFVLLLAGFVFLFWDKLPNLIMALFSPNITNKNQDETPPPKPEQIIYMKFDGKKMELDGNECRRPGELPNLVYEIRNKYQKKEIVVIYKNTPDDPYELAEEFVQALRSHKFKVVRDREDQK